MRPMRMEDRTAPRPPLALTGILPVWDVVRRRADTAPVAAWALAEIRRLGHPVESLDTIHRHLDGREARALAKALTAASLSQELRRSVQRAVLLAVPEIPSEHVWIQTHTHFRV